MSEQDERAGFGVPERMWLRRCGGGTTLPSGRTYTTMVGDDFEKPGHIEYVRADSAVTISAVELLALKKLALISGALAQSLSDKQAAREQRALTSVLVDVVSRAAISKATTDSRDGADQDQPQ
jgi:hypothetical protein